MLSLRLNSLLASTLLLSAFASLDAAEPDAVITSGGLKFAERLMWPDGGYVYGITATDIDGDGDLDFSSAGVHTDMLLWHENDGEENFTKHIICDNEPGYLERHAFGDINGDGTLDVVMVKNKIGHLVWWENNGTPGDGKLWGRHVITTDFMRAYDVALMDLDDDGDLDVAASAYTGDCFSWFENPGPKGFDNEWKQYKFDSDKEFANTRTVAFADFNGDGKPDLLGTGTYGNKTLWYENTGKAGVKKFSRNIIDDKLLMPAHGHPVDMDDDGDIDIVMAGGMRVSTTEKEQSHQAVWYENVGSPGRGSEWTRHFVGHLDFGLEAVVGDLDGDGDIDVIATGCDGGQPGVGEVSWFENTGDLKGEWKKHVLRMYPRAAQVIVMDMDEDGNLDIAASSEAGTFYWWRNLGSAK
ncbi:MAG: VCBS repeat-containing protein [Planctomycetota bacterium]|nr:VCBS repeat-containing protein [Planctomycetota bacterium]MDA1213804.1 VCBS repeat-containing protein [Planctomycetota bacterium]